MYKIKNYIFFSFYLILNPKLIKMSLLDKIYIPVYVQFEWLRKYKISTIIDAGANQGKVSQAVKYIFPEATVYAFEPNQKLHSTIKNTIKNKLTLISFALSDKNGIAKFHSYTDPAMSSLLPLAEDKNKKIIKVKTVTIDKYFKNKNLKKEVFLKIDTQGAEELILRGAKNTLKNISIIHIETFFSELYKNQTYFEKVYKFLTENGFKYIGDAQEAYFYPNFGPQKITNSVFINSKLNI